MSATAPAPTTEWISPDDIVIDDNVRTEVKLTESFLESIREHGVLVPIRAIRGRNGKLYVRDGQCRVLGAQEVNAPSIPAFIVADDEQDTTRILEQLITNDERSALRPIERVQAINQLALGGLSVPTIAKRLGQKRKTVQDQMAVAKSAAASAAIANTGVTLDAALALLDFENDPDLAASILTCAETNPAQLEHTISRARQALAERRAVEDAGSEFRDAGIPVVTYDSENTGTRLRDLTNDAPEDGKTGTMLTLDEHTSCPGHAMLLTVYYGGRVDASPVCLAPEDNDHHPRHAASDTSGPMTDEQKAARKLLIERNKAWDATVDVRLKFLTTLLTRPKLPTDAASWAIITLSRFAYEVSNGGQGIAHKIAGKKEEHVRRGNGLATWVEAQPTKAVHATLALALGGLEASTSRETWRHPQDWAIHYFTQLESWGYPLSTVERLIFTGGEKTPAN